MPDLKDPKWMYLKAALFVLIGLTSAVLIFLESRSLRMGVLLMLTIWAFCRAYYFAFYVIEHYVDSQFKFSGLISFARYLMRKP